MPSKVNSELRDRKLSLVFVNKVKILGELFDSKEKTEIRLDVIVLALSDYDTIVEVHYIPFTYQILMSPPT